MRRLSVWIDLIGMGQALAGHGPASGPASGARKRSGRTLQRPRPWWSSRNACEQFSAEMLESGQFPSRARSRAHSGVRRSPLVHCAVNLPPPRSGHPELHYPLKARGSPAAAEHSPECAPLPLLSRTSTSLGACGWSTGCLVLSSVRGLQMNVCWINGARGA